MFISDNVTFDIPFIVSELVSMVIRRNNVHQENIFSFGVQSCDFHFEAGEHPPVKDKTRFIGATWCFYQTGEEVGYIQTRIDYGKFSWFSPVFARRNHF